MTNKAKLEAAIFDMDGVLIDSQPLHFETDNYLLKSFNIDPADVDLTATQGKSNPDIWRGIIERFGITAPLDEIMQKSVEIKLKLFAERDCVPIAGIPELLQSIQAANVKRAVASSSAEQVVHLVLQKIGVRGFFDVVVSGESVTKSKPEPEVFLKTASLLGVRPEICVVLEDAAHGVTAAKRAGMKCVGYRNRNTGNQDLSRADFIVDRFADVTLARLRGLWD
jgi:HAD superfamily hydrolase (TIGR01509 family)